MSLIKSSGQTLLEVTIGIGITMIIVTALTIVTIIGLRNSQFSQQESKATKLAQDWMDQVRSMRDQNSLICPGGSNPSKWTDPLGSSGLFNQNCSSNCNYIIANSCLTVSPIGDTSISPFLRKISIQDYQGSKTSKQVIIIVSWSDFAGVHQSKLVEILGQP